MNFFKPDPKKATIKDIRKDKKQANKIVTMAGDLARCEDFFISVIRMESVNVEKRRKLRVSDRNEKDRVRDAVIGFLATEELLLDLPSVESEQKLDKALGKLSRITLKMQLLAPGTPSVGMKDIYNEMNGTMDNTMEPITLSLRAGMVDELFINKLITGVLDGKNIKDLIHKLLDDYVENGAESEFSDKPDFTQYEDHASVNKDLFSEFENLC